MFIIYFAKTMAIIATYLIFVAAISVLILYFVQMYAAIKSKAEPHHVPRIAVFAKVLVFSIDAAIMGASGFFLYFTADWQKEILGSLKNIILVQPYFGLLLIPMILYPALSIKKLATDLDK